MPNHPSCAPLTLEGMKLKISSEAFFRPNIFLAETLIQTVLEMSAVQPGDVVWAAWITSREFVGPVQAAPPRPNIVFRCAMPYCFIVH